MKRLNRRSFLALSAASAASAASVASPALGALPTSGDTDVVIVGAGAAGIAAARRVAAAGRRFVLLEASGRVGGRCFTETRSFGIPYDRGAHAVSVPDINPVAKLATRAGMEIYRAPQGQKIRVGRRYAREGEMEDLLANAVRSNRSIADAVRGKPDISCARALPVDLADWRPTIDFMLGPYGCAGDLDEISATDFARSTERRDDSYCRQGYGALVAKLAQDVQVELSTPATRIDTSRSLEIETPRGRLSARAAIVTVSIGVLASGAIRFTPDLPRRHLDGLAKLKLGAYERVALEIPGNPLQLQKDDVVLEKSENNRTAGMLANVGESALCFVDFGGRFGRELAAQGEPAMVDFATEWLGRLYGADIKKLVRRSHATQWMKDPLALGSSSFALVGGQFSRKVLMEPIRDRVFFAGEAAHETLWGTVAGAWESGERAADAVLKIFAPRQAPVRPQKPRRS